jgi:hypothetical protein
MLRVAKPAAKRASVRVLSVLSDEERDDFIRGHQIPLFM